MGKVLGLDIGISSVGWGIIDSDTGNVVDAGVRLFEEADRNANEDRRSFRGSRRLKRRRNHRLERVKVLLEKADFPLSSIGQENPYLARFNAIYKEVPKDTLSAALFHLAKKRGTVIDSPEDDNESGNELSTKEQLKRNKKLLETRYVCEIQLERLSDGHQKMRNHENRFRTEDYMKEAKAILENQKQYHSELTEKFCEDFLNLLAKRRAYYEGPGSEKSPTPYGRFFINDQGILEEMSMIDKMRGHCTYYPEELRIAKMSFTADLYNLLSGDLNKLQIEGEYLTYDDKKHFVEEVIKKGKNLTLPIILKYKGKDDKATVSGYRIDMKTDKPVFTEFKGYKKILKTIESNNLPIQLKEDIEVLDQIVAILTSEKSYDRRNKQLIEVLSAYSLSEQEKIVEAFIENTDFIGFHALSKKAIMAIMDDLWKTNKNQIQLFAEMGLEKKRLEEKTKSFNIQFDDDAILSTVAKRAHRETIKIVNATRKKYGEFETIVVETAKEKNSEEKRKQYSEFQKKTGKHEKEMAKMLGVPNLKDLYLNSKQHLALKLWASQDMKCIYSGKSISIHNIVKDASAFEIDHILPVSLSFDDSQANKVLCYQTENQKKGQMTPFQYFLSGRASRTYDEFKVDVMQLMKSRKITNKKKTYLLEERDLLFNKELQKEFINRNLVDTQYAMRSFSMTLRAHFIQNEIDTAVLSIRGSFTAALRKRARLNKNRHEGYAHHAQDALIVAAIGKLPVFEFFNQFHMDEQGMIIDKETGEIMHEDQFFSHKYLQFLRSFMNYEPHIKYSHKVDRKGNRSLSNQTIYGTREKDGELYYLGKSKNIYQMDKKGVEPLLKRLQKSPNSFLIAEHNPELFALILKIVKEYPKADNPFKAYYDEHGYIKKDGKVPLKVLRYRDRKLGVHMDISQKYAKTKNPVVLLSVKSVRIDIYKSSEGKFKYVGVPYHWFKRSGNRMELNMELYNAELKKPYKKIDEGHEFLFSLYQNDHFNFEKNGKLFERVFRGDNNPRQNKIEVDYVFKKKEEQKEGFLAPSTFTDTYKYNVDILGNKHRVQKEKFNKYLQI